MLRNEDNLLAEIEIIEDNTKESTDILVLNPKKVEKTKLYSLSNKCLLLQVSSTVTLGLSNEMALMVRQSNIFYLFIYFQHLYVLSKLRILH